MGNIFSVQKKLLQEDALVSVSSNPQDIINADKLILLGVGHFKKAMDNLKNLSLLEPLNESVLVQKKPILGICLGMQLMGLSSEESDDRVDAEGLGWVDASVKKFVTNDTSTFKIPHIGWNNIQSQKDSNLLADITSEDEFYFVHSFFMNPNDQDISLTKTSYINEFCSSIEKENIFGVQFHPEKSHDAGRKLLQNFISI